MHQELILVLNRHYHLFSIHIRIQTMSYLRYRMWVSGCNRSIWLQLHFWHHFIFRRYQISMICLNPIGFSIFHISIFHFLIASKLLCTSKLGLRVFYLFFELHHINNMIRRINNAKFSIGLFIIWNGPFSFIIERYKRIIKNKTK